MKLLTRCPMINLFLSILVIPLLFSCISAPPIPADLCADKDQSKSVLLKVAAIKEIPLNEVYYGLIDIAAIGMATKQVDRQKLQDYMNKISKWYVKNYPVSYNTLIQYMVEEESAMQLAGILSRRIGDFKSYLFISQYDDCMLRAGWSDAMDQLFLKKE